MKLSCQKTRVNIYGTQIIKHGIFLKLNNIILFFPIQTSKLFFTTLSYDNTILFHNLFALNSHVLHQQNKPNISPKFNVYIQAVDIGVYGNTVCPSHADWIFS